MGQITARCRTVRCDSTNIPVYGIFNRSTDTNFVMDNELFNPVNLQDALSADITNRLAGSLFVAKSGVRRFDGKPLTETGPQVAAGTSAIVTGPGSALSTLNSPGFLVVSNAWNVANYTNSMPNYSSVIGSSNGVPVVIYLSNGVVYINNLSNPAGGIIP
jgi:hypothetical protein